MSQKRRARHQKHTVSYLYPFFLHYIINIWDRKVHKSVFYDHLNKADSERYEIQ